MILTKNDMVDLNVFFYKKNFTNIHRPLISFIKIDDATSVQPIFHIGFEKNMGFISSYSVVAGVMVFEVLEGTPLQSLLFMNNTSRDNEYKSSITELDPMDFYVVQNRNLDPYGDFILTDLKFVSTKMEQNVNKLGRQLVAEFVCSSKKPFKLPYFYNSFKSDNYDYHVIRNKEEFKLIESDISEVSSQIPNLVSERCKNIYNITDSTVTLESVFVDAQKTFLAEYRKVVTKATNIFPQESKKMTEFIREFYKYKNEVSLNQVRADSRLDFLNFKEGGVI